MKKPALVIMAAGMGSRYGGLKQIDPMDEEGHIIMDFSVYDAKRAGFEQVVFVIKKENEADFRETIGRRVERVMDTAYVYQDLAALPDGFSAPEGRVKPWGTAHAVLAAAPAVEGSFAVINADDYYGPHAFTAVYDFLTAHGDDEKYRYTMAAYRLENTVTENGHVARGVCTLDENRQLVGICERTRIEKRGGGIAFTEDGGESWTPIPGNTLVSMNMWGFTHSLFTEIAAGFPAFLEQGLKENPLKCEYFLPTVVSNLIAAGKASVTVLDTADTWYGVTYREDKPTVMQAFRKMKEAGVYPQYLWR